MSDLKRLGDDRLDDNFDPDEETDDRYTADELNAADERMNAEAPAPKSKPSGAREWWHARHFHGGEEKVFIRAPPTNSAAWTVTAHVIERTPVTARAERMLEIIKDLQELFYSGGKGITDVVGDCDVLVREIAQEQKLLADIARDGGSNER